MRFIIGILLSFVFSFLLICLIFLLPLPIVLTQENTKQTLHQINFYERVIDIIEQKSFKELGASDSFFAQIFHQNLNQIINKEWLVYFGDTLINFSFDSLSSNQDFVDPQIELGALKANFLNVLKNSDIKQDPSKIVENIPDQMLLSQMLETNPNQLQTVFSFLSRLVHIYKLALITTIFLIGLTLLFFFALLPKKQTIIWLAANFILVAIMILVLTLSFNVWILSPPFLQNLANQVNSTWILLQIVVSLAFLEKLFRYWSFLAIVLFILGFLVIMFKLLKSGSNEKNSHRDK